jgi:hypothetical protein
LWLLRSFLTLLHEALLGRASERPAVPVDSLNLAGILLAFLQKARLGSADKRLAILAHGLAFAGLLRESGREAEVQNPRCNQHLFHSILLPSAIFPSAFDGAAFLLIKARL